MLHTLIPQENDWKVQLLSSWDTVMGNLASKVRLEKIQDDTLILAAHDSCWLQELYLLSDLLITQINNHLGQPRIRNLRFKKAGEYKKKATPHAHTQQRSFKHVTLTAQEHTALGSVKDPQLRAALEQFLIRCYREKE